MIKYPDYRLLLQEYEEGTYTTLMRYGLTSLREFKKEILTRGNWKNLSDYEKHNIKRAITEIVMTFVFLFVILGSTHSKAPKYLAMLSFAESSFFPVPPDVMLGPMCMARPWLSYRFAYIAIAFSVLGGILGYTIGYLSFETIVEPLLGYFGQTQNYAEALAWFQKWGFVSILLAGFTPMPYKLFTIGAGVMQYNILLFILGSIIGRASVLISDIGNLIPWPVVDHGSSP